MKNLNVKEVDAYISEEAPKKGEKQVVKSLLTVPFGGLKVRVAVRVEDVLYASTRLGNLIFNDEGFEVDVTHCPRLIGKKYTLSEQGGKCLQQGNITAKIAAFHSVADESKQAEVINISKTGTK